ncbi:MAG: carbohydrate binding domain-containing protein [Bacteroidaceae bacterium]|nr:carbohydrate binding domain-containing protein [Bacteroidaceae bacterium]
MKTNFSSRRVAGLSVLCLLCALCASAQQAVFEFSTAHRGPVIGPLHYGIFYEEINHAGDGGIYAELIRNGSMEENSSTPNYWQTVGNATFSIISQNLINGAQKQAMRLNLTEAGDGTRNTGYWGISIVEGQTYKASFWIRTDGDWTGSLTLTLENDGGDDLGQAVVAVSDAGTWKKYTAEITATGNCQQGWFAIRGSQAGTVYLDCVSLFPPTFKGRENGMRIDLAEKLAALHPKFMRFPGGCYIEGGNRYQWRHTVGPVEERLGIYNSHWGYPVTNGMGFHEFLQLAEDLGAEPMFVVNMGMGHGWYENYQHIEGYVQEALDALEYANGDVTTFWGAKRAAAGHPESFGMRLIEIGNENYNYTFNNNNDQSDHYPERYRQFYDAIKARWPETICIGNVEAWGTDNPSWRNAHPVDVVDEHYYKSPDWFAGNYHKYDNASRSSHKIYNGEYAVTSDFGTNGTLKAALGEAIYMAGMERNSDVCIMASYAPIFINENDSQWRPDMLHYNAYASFGTPSYWAQQMMAETVGKQNITWTETGNSIGFDAARLGVGSWSTSVTYSNIRVTDAGGDIIFEQAEAVTTPQSLQGSYRTFDVCTNNCTIEMDAVKNSGDEGFLVAFAHIDATNYAWWNLGGWSNSKHAVEQAVNGTKSTLTDASGSITTGRTYHIKIVRQGLTARCYLDGTLIHTVTLQEKTGQRLYLCASLNEAEDTAILKVINYNAEAVPASFTFPDATLSGDADLRIMSNADNYAENSMEEPEKVMPKNEKLTIESENSLSFEVPAYSLSVIQIPLSKVSVEEKPQSAEPPSAAISYDFEDDAQALDFADGNRAFYTADNNYADLGNEAALAIGRVLNGETYSVSINLMFADSGHLDNYCWAWNVNNGTSSFAGLINQENNVNWYFQRVSNGSRSVNSRSGLMWRTWHNVTVTADATTTSLYIDGVLRATEPTNTNALVLNASTVAWIGRSPYAADDLMSQTFFDDFAVYDCVLTPAQVLALYEAAAAKSTECPAFIPEPDTEPNADAIGLIGDGEEVDITSLLKNANFANGGNYWEGTSFTAAPGTVAEQYNKVFDTYQVIPNMPAGVYRLNWQGFYRNGNIANGYLRHTFGTEDTAEVYANEHATNLLSIYDASVPYTYDPYNYPDNVSTANNAFLAGHYKQTMEFALEEASDLRIGLRHFTPTVYDWACVDNFKLIYVTDNATRIEEVYNEKQGMGTSAVYDISGRRVATSASSAPALPKGVYIINGKKVVIDK